MCVFFFPELAFSTRESVAGGVRRLCVRVSVMLFYHSRVVMLDLGACGAPLLPSAGVRRVLPLLRLVHIFIIRSVLKMPFIDAACLKAAAKLLIFLVLIMTPGGTI